MQFPRVDQIILRSLEKQNQSVDQPERALLLDSSNYILQSIPIDRVPTNMAVLTETSETDLEKDTSSHM